MSDHGDGETWSSQSRWWLTNDVLAFVLATAFISYVFAGVYLDGYPETNPAVLTAFVTAFGVAVAWAFGRDAVEAWRAGGNE